MKKWLGTVIKIKPMIRDGKSQRKEGVSTDKSSRSLDGVQQQKRVTADSAALRSGEGKAHRPKKKKQVT